MAAFLLAPFAVRIAQLVEQATDPIALDLRGFASDALAALILLAIAAPLARLWRGLGLGVLTGWTLLQHANYENVTELGSLASVLDLEFLGSETFVLGSATVISNPWLLAFITIGSLGLGWFGLARGSTRLPLASLGGAAVLLLVTAIWTPSDEYSQWRQANVLDDNVRYLIRVALRPPDPGPRFADPPTAMLDLLPELGADLSGEPRIPTEGRARNVVLLAIEGLSAAHIAPLATVHGYDDMIQLKELGDLAREHLAYSTFINNNRKTSRGTFALTCGELPNLAPATPKMTEHAQAGWRTCLPAVLRQAGFATVYQQAAPLAFMLKDQFMARAGFERVQGFSSLKRAYARSHWGVDDRAFLEQASELIQELHGAEKPFYLQLLTVGTHHPAVIPSTWESHRTGHMRKAMRYLDIALAEFIADLRERGILDDTLLLITSDESRGLKTPKPDLPIVRQGVSRKLAYNWSVLIAIEPSGTSARIDEPFSQMDVALSILDYLGLADRGPHFFGRSVFRRYAEPRTVYFANTNILRVYALHPERGLLSCNVLIGGCTRYALSRGRPFADHLEPVDTDPELDAKLKELARRSILHRSGEARRDYQLVASGLVELNPNFRNRKVVHGGQHVDLPADQWLEVEVEVKAVGPGDGGGQVTFEHYIRNSSTWSSDREVPSTTHLSQTVKLQDGDVYRLKYTLASDHFLQGVKCQSYAQTRRGEWKLQFKTARMSVRYGPGRPGNGARIIRSEVTRSSDRAGLRR